MRKFWLSERHVAVMVFCATLLVYGLTMCRTIYTGDDGDFETAMATGGVAHPSGYPLFTLLGRFLLFGLKPLLAEPALRINVMTACFGAGAAAFFFRFLCQALDSRRVAATLSLLVAFAPTLWQQSLSCEVYTLTALCLTAALWLAVRLLKGEDTLAALALVYGLGLTNNLVLALFLPGFLGLALGKLGWQRLVRLKPIAGFLAPLLLYAYLPIAARLESSPLCWGDPQTPARFWFHVTGAQYRPLMFSQPLATQGERLIVYGQRFLLPELGVSVCALALVGLAVLARRRAPLLWLSLWIFVVSVVWATNYAITDIYVYYIPSYLCVAFWAGEGVCALGRAALNRVAPGPERRAGVLRLATWLLLAVPTITMSQHYAGADKSGNYLEADYAHNILASAPEGALILTTDSVGFTLWYEKYVKKNRPDIVPVSALLYLGNAVMGHSWYERALRREYPSLPQKFDLSDRAIADGALLQRVVRQALGEGRPVLFVADARGDGLSNGGLMSLNEQLRPFRRVPWGIAERLYLPEGAPSEAELWESNAALWPTFKERGVYSGWARNDPFQVHIAFRYFDANKAMGSLAERAGQGEAARTFYERARTLYADPEIDAALAHLP